MEAENNVIVLMPGESMHDYKGPKQLVVKPAVKPVKQPVKKKAKK